MANMTFICISKDIQRLCDYNLQKLKRALVMIVNDFKSTYHLILYYNSLI